MRTCEEALELISAALDGPLTDNEQAALDEHLSRCPACSALLEELRGLQAAAAELEDVPAPAGFAGRVMDAIAADPAQEQPDNVIPFPARKTARFRWKGWAASAAVVAIVVLGAVALPGRLGVGMQTASTADCAAPALAEEDNTGAAFSLDTMDSGTETGASAEGRSTAQTDAADITAEAMPESMSEEAVPEYAESPEKDALTASSPMSADADAGALPAYCGTITLTGEPLPEGLEDYEVTEDEQGNRTYVVPADYFFSNAAILEAQQASNFTYSADQVDTDPTAEYGLIIVVAP